MQIAEYTDPFRHWVIDGFLKPEAVRVAYQEIPPANSPCWVRYHNDCEQRKRTCRESLGPALWQALGLLGDLRMTLTGLTGIVGLEADTLLHGGGLHVTDPGGWLQPHLDYALHPHREGLERRVNLVCFLNSLWREEWGGGLDFYDDTATAVKQRWYPAPGRTVVWTTSETAYHGTQQVHALASPRATLAVYYLAKARPGAVRKRALFVPRRSP